eukprot:1142297-Pelagomonas_calceolata.AAC.1
MSLQAASGRMLVRAARSVTCMARLTIVCSSTESVVHQLAWSNANGHNKVLIGTGRCTQDADALQPCQSYDQPQKDP